MEILVWVVLGVLVYPLFAAWLVGLRSASRIDELEVKVAALRDAQRRVSSTEVPVPEKTEDHVVEKPEAGEAPVAAPVRHIDNPVEKYLSNAPIYTRVHVPTVTNARRRKLLRTHSPAEPKIASVVPPETSEKDDSSSPPPPRWLITARAWLMTGNLVAKLGLVILFIRVAFLLKYVAATIVIPMELRLAAVVAADLVLLAWGWRLRIARREMALPIQGTSIAILMLVIFGASQRYELVPVGLAFALLVLLMVFTCLLAVLQDSGWLAAFGIIGGFACPLLLSTGQGSHVALFSYYALLNGAVFALAIKRSWRLLNLLAFAFTFIVGTAWGGLRYTPENYLSAQAFLILFFLLYVAIPLAFALQQQARQKEYVDAVLVLATPLLAFGLQVGLVKDKPFGLALSALALGGFYLVLATILLRQGRERWRLMLEAYIASGVIFGTLAIPFALDGRWTSAAWAVEGVGLAWLGLRRQQRIIWLFGLLLQVGAWWSFLAAAASLDPDAARSANLWLGFLLLAASAFAISVRLRKQVDEAAPLPEIAGVGLTVAAAWLLAGGWTEAILRYDGDTLANWLVISALFTAVLLYVIGARLVWPLSRHLALVAQLLGGVALGIFYAPQWTWTMPLEEKLELPLLGILMLAASALVTSRMLMRVQEGSHLATSMLVWAGLWWFGPAINVAAGRLTDYVPESLGYAYACWTALYAVAVGISALAFVRIAPRLAWPQLRWLAAVCWAMLALITWRVLHSLYGWHELPVPALWIAVVVLWASTEYTMARWSAGGAGLAPPLLKSLHLLRTAGPWLAIWPAGAIVIDTWLSGAADQPNIMQDGWVIDASWSNYVPTWAMMLVLLVLLRRSLANKWPATPVGDWYRSFIIPGATVLLALLVATWNVKHDGAMAPLPYMPLLNPLDLTTGFALLLCAGVLRQFSDLTVVQEERLHQLRVFGLIAVFAWFNLMLLRSTAHYLDIAYRLPDLAASQFVQAMLSLVWSASALLLMWIAARRTMPRTWWSGALVLAIVVLKLFLIDLASGGSIARVISFVGVGLLLLLVGYLAPFPKVAQGAPPVATA